MGKSGTVMNRIYQGRVSKVEIPDEKNAATVAGDIGWDNLTRG